MIGLNFRLNKQHLKKIKQKPRQKPKLHNDVIQNHFRF